MTKKKRSEFKFDAALSFAGADRLQAEKLATAMKLRGLRVFYDKDHHAHLWGKKRTEYEKIYGPDSAYVVPMISKSYAEREWTQWEFETAKREAKRRQGDFLLPIRLDDSRQFGLTDDHNYLGMSDYTPDEIAQALEAKIKIEYSQNKKTTRRVMKIATVLTAADRKALGMLVASPVPTARKQLQLLFPDIDWPTCLRRFKHLKLITEDVLVYTAKDIERSFDDERTDFESHWQTRLEEMQEYVDFALFLSVLYIKNRRFEDAVSLVTGIVLSVSDTRFLPLCTTILELLDSKPTIVRYLSPDLRLSFLCALGHCLTAEKRIDESSACFEKLRKNALRQKNKSYVGLALLNLGVNHHKKGEVETAIKFYERSRVFSHKHRLKLLESHSLGNLGQVLLERDPVASIKLLRESLALKRKCKDLEGIAGTKQVLAQAYTEIHDFESAFLAYDEAESLASENGFKYVVAVLLFNKANSLLSAGKYSEAIRTYARAKRLAYVEHFEELHVCALEGICRVQYKSGKLQAAQREMNKLLQYAEKAAMTEYVMIAQHGLWAIKTRSGDVAGALKHFKTLIRLARKERSIDWTVRALVDRSRPVRNGDFAEPDPRLLKSLIQTESCRNDKATVAVLWLELARVLCPQHVRGAFDAVGKCIEFCEGDSGAIDLLLDAYEFQFTLYWDFDRDVCEAMKSLDSIVSIAQKFGKIEKELSAVGQKGSCLLELNRGKEALRLLESVADRARKHKMNLLATESLYNLAECNVRLGKIDAAVLAFKMARKIAVASKDIPLLIEIDQGQARALESSNNFGEALKLYKQCRNRARRFGLWSEYLQACGAIADLSWKRGRIKTAVMQYRMALIACETHKDVEVRATIALNLSRLLRDQGEAYEACRILRKNSDFVSDPSLIPDYYSTLAELLAETDQLDDARKTYQVAIKAAEEICDDDQLVYCRSSYAAFELNQGNSRRSSQELEELLSYELSNEDRGIILMQLLSSLLQRKSEKRAGEVFRVALEHLQAHGPSERLVDLHMTLFDYNWSGNRSSRFVSLQSYVSAFGAAVSCDDCVESLSSVMSHVILKLTQHQTAPTLRQLNWLGWQLETWLIDQLSSTDLISVLMYPIRYAEKMIPFNRDPVKLLEMHKRHATNEFKAS